MWLGLLMTRLLRLPGRGRMQIRGRELIITAEIRGQERWRGEVFQAEALNGYSLQALFTRNVTEQYSLMRKETWHQGLKDGNQAEHIQLTSLNLRTRIDVTGFKPSHGLASSALATAGSHHHRHRLLTRNRTLTHIHLLCRPRRRNIEIEDIHRQPQRHARIWDLQI